MNSASSVAFPRNSESNETPVTPAVILRSPHLPFRRISLPAISRFNASPLSNRLSLASTTSLESTTVGDSSTTPSVIGETSKQPASPRNRRRYTSSNHHLSKEITAISKEMNERRRKVVNEILNTERAYVNGLDLIYTVFLTPLIESLDTPQPILSRSEIPTLFSNFIDIWNFNRSFLTSLACLLSDQEDYTPLSPILISHFPYLSLYTPFITSFPSILTNLARLTHSNSTFSEFVRKQETDSRCGKLTLGDWLLTIVQRCPRYLLLIKDLISCTEPSDPEHQALLQVRTVLSKITQSLDTSLHVHSQTIGLLALQRTIVDLPFQFVQPGRTLIRRGSLYQGQVEKDPPAFREFLLFSDYLVWLSQGDARIPDDRLHLPILSRGRSRSETELLGSTSRGKQASSEETWECKGHIALVDMEVVIVPVNQNGSERARFDILSPSISFAVYAASEDERETWVTEIRNAKAALLASLNTMHTNSTLTSSLATTHLRRVLQALPEEDGSSQKRGRVDHFLPAVWVPDSKTDNCMRCNAIFNWRKRRHHCRLCGRCVCADCSAKTFFISDVLAKNTKRARSCNACYGAVFPIIQDSPEIRWQNPEEAQGDTDVTPNMTSISSQHADDTDSNSTIGKLPSFQSVLDVTPVRSAPLGLMRRTPVSTPPSKGLRLARPLSQPVLASIDVDAASQDPFHAISLSETPDSRGRRPSFSVQSSIPQLRHRRSSVSLAVTPEVITTKSDIFNIAGLKKRRSSLALSGKIVAQMEPIQDDNSGLAEDTEYAQASNKLGEILHKEEERRNSNGSAIL